MNNQNINIYTISGLGADERVFYNLKLNYKTINLNWIVPLKNETISDYAIRMIDEYGIDQNANNIFIGVSFGGILAVELYKLLNPLYIISISSYELNNELPQVIRCNLISRVIYYLPKSLFKPPKYIIANLFGAQNKELLYEILSDTDPEFVRWALVAISSWRNEQVLERNYKIAGENDRFVYTENKDKLIHGEGHFVIVDKSDEISDLINNKIDELC